MFRMATLDGQGDDFKDIQQQDTFGEKKKEGHSGKKDHVSQIRF